VTCDLAASLRNPRETLSEICSPGIGITSWPGVVLSNPQTPGSARTGKLHAADNNYREVSLDIRRWYFFLEEVVLIEE
jgi:hypothetical protein